MASASSQHAVKRSSARCSSFVHGRLPVSTGVVPTECPNYYRSKQHVYEPVTLKPGLKHIPSLVSPDD